MKRLEEAQKNYSLALQKAQDEYKSAVISALSESIPDLLTSTFIAMKVRDAILNDCNDSNLDSILTQDTVVSLIKGALKTNIDKSLHKSNKELLLSSPPASFLNAKFIAVRLEDENGNTLVRVEGTKLAELLNGVSAEMTKLLNISFEGYDDFLVDANKTYAFEIIDKSDFNEIKADFEAKRNVGKKSKQRYLIVLTDDNKDLLVCSRSGALSNEGRIKIAKLVLGKYIDLSQIIFELA